MARPTVAVIGAGTWGMALAGAAARTSGTTLLYSRRELDPTPLPGVQVVRSLKDVGAEARLLILAVPSSVAEQVAVELSPHIDGRHLVVHGVRGLTGPELSTVSDVVRRTTAARRLGALGGPVLADELLAGKPSVMVCGSSFPEVSEAVAEAFRQSRLRLYSTTDLRGLEWASALVGCLAIGIGYLQELALGPGIMAAATTRAVQEAARIIEAAGGDHRTMMGLSGYGDLLACTTQKERPEVRLGAAIARGQSLEQAIEGARLRVEGLTLIPQVAEWSRRHRVRAPIFAALTEGMFTGRSADDILHDLMTGPMADATEFV